ncbi:MarR family winged helix-turn-helix transcriptional regulator [Flagellimonas pacifica]|uniref:DNA-binding transcriptional regulator, MarR family n=1 Tax=Flagellimonas pacifica TaxID=1247520 RepID=A0A285MFD2_9FLAO|nr:MarR family transcriptional regulator [Allomuricauda parva]SNY94666.1 DNA-binding transcriptional regulator, MarR family [Allomuricauda parva]
MKDQMKETDLLDELIVDWKRERPDLDASAMNVVGRILFLGKKFEKQTSLALQEYGIYYTDLDVLATLRRSGKPFQLTPTQLRKSVLITSGAMTALLDRLEKMGLLFRLPDPKDGRVSLAVLSNKGRRVIDRAISSRFRAAESNLLGLNKSDREQLTQLLKKIIVSMEKQ